jgi:hypothetical protein
MSSPIRRAHLAFSTRGNSFIAKRTQKESGVGTLLERTGAMNQFLETHAYRTFHKGKCYQLGINVATANPKVYEPPARDLTAADWREVNGTLEQALKSFRSLK